MTEHEKQDNCLEGDFSLVEVPSQGADSLNFSLEQVEFQSSGSSKIYCPKFHLYQEVEIDGETWCLEQESRNTHLDNSTSASSWKVEQTTKK